MITLGESKLTGEEVAMTHFNALAWHSPWEIEKTRRRTSEQSVSLPSMNWAQTNLLHSTVLLLQKEILNLGSTGDSRRHSSP